MTSAIKLGNRSKIIIFVSFLSLFLAGGLLPLAFAPFNLWFLAFISPGILFYEWQRKISPKQAFIQGLIFGLGFFGVGISWVFVSIHEFGNTHFSIAGLMTLVLVLLFAAMLGAQGYVFKKYFRGQTFSALLLGLPSLWILFEWLRSWFLTGFPWLFLGYSQLDTALSGYAPLFSVYGVSLAVTFSIGAVLAVFTTRKLQQTIAILCLSLVWLGGLYFKNQSWTVTQGSPQTVSLIQGNIPPLEKFSKHGYALAQKIYGDLMKTCPNSQLIIWPEDAIPLPLPYSSPYINELHALANSKGATLIAGIQTKIEDAYFNSLIAIGKGQGLYHKHHLLPFGDFLPFENFLRGFINFFNIPASSFQAGDEKQNLIVTDTLKLNPQICYEIAFPEQIRKTLKEAAVIVTISEDGWFGNSLGPHQHLEIARMRALETGRPVLRATTSGISAIIDHQGKILGSAPQFQAFILTGEFQPQIGDTPWIKWGLYPLILILLLAFFLPGRISS